MPKLIQLTILFICCMLFASKTMGAATTYFIDCQNGNDSNDGLSKSTPWQHAPGMTGASGGPLTIDDGSGNGNHDFPDTNFIFKGGVICGASNFPWIWRQEGTSGHNIYIGVDQSWYSGTTWTRPIMDWQAAVAATSPMFKMAPMSYVVMDNLEWRGLYFANNAGLPDGVICYINTGSSNNFEMKNLYFHGWTHAAFNGGATVDSGRVICGNSQGTDVGSSIHDSVIDGWDSTGGGDSMDGGFGGPPVWYNNVIRNIGNGFIGGSLFLSFHDNLFSDIKTSFQPGKHQNGIENNGSAGAEVYNNVFRNFQQGALGIWMAPYVSAPSIGSTAYIYNNVIYNTNIASLSPGNIYDVSRSLLPASYGYAVEAGAGYGPTGTVYSVNNTFVGGDDTVVNQRAQLLGCQDGSRSSGVSVSLSTSGANSVGSTSLTVLNTGGSDFSFSPNASASFFIAGDATRYYVINSSKLAVSVGSTASLTIVPALTRAEPAGSTIANVYWGNEGCIHKNNLLITTYAVGGGSPSPVNSGYPNQVLGTNVTLHPVAAAVYLMNSLQAYPWIPTTVGISASPAISQGENLTSLCNTADPGTGQAVFTALCQDTTLGVTEGPGSGGYVVIVPTRAPLIRPNGAWTVGAYQIGGSIATKPAPPTKLSLVVN